MIHTAIKGMELTLETSPDVFSPGSVDRGTLAMLSEVDFKAGDKVLDLGCGYGVVGIFAAKIAGAENVVMSDISETALQLARGNARLNRADAVQIIASKGFARIEAADFTLILSNPPYHTDFSVPKEFIENGYRHLSIGGRMYMVTKRLTWYKNKFIAIFGGVKIQRIDGYYVFMAEKRASMVSKPKKK